MPAGVVEIIRWHGESLLTLLVAVLMKNEVNSVVRYWTERLIASRWTKILVFRAEINEFEWVVIFKKSTVVAAWTSMLARIRPAILVIWEWTAYSDRSWTVTSCVLPRSFTDWLTMSSLAEHRAARSSNWTETRSNNVIFPRYNRKR